jgi:diguanylate cyclase (GGDEF)-like protein
VHLRFAITDDMEEHLLRDLYESSVRDPLTGVYNRKHFNERLAMEIAYSRRHRTPLALLMIDIDHFKQVNDTYGHLAGDRVLKAMAAIVMRTIRTEDIFARYGGEEFTVIARGIEGKGAMVLAERIRSLVETARIVREDKWIPVTLSVGVATGRCCGDDLVPEKLVGLADQRLYQAKLEGRNRAVGPAR